MSGTGDFIDRKAALRDWPLCDEPGDAYHFIRNFPAADVRPVVRSEWKIHHKTNIAVCKCCSYQYMMGAPWHEYPPRFCPNCGADMRGEAE